MVPAMAPHSSTLVRHGDVSDRLYSIAEQQRHKQRIAEHRKKILHDHSIDPDTGRQLFVPKINKSSAAMVKRRRPPSYKVQFVNEG